MSFKNSLQEHYQRNNCPLPTYVTVREGGLPHQPLWKSTVTLHEGIAVTSQIQSSKTAAEQSAAETALQYLQQLKASRVKRRMDPRTVLLVDIENLPTLISEVVEEIEGLTIIGFVGVHHCLSNKSLPDGVLKIVSPSTRPDGTDTCIQVYVGWLLSQNRYDTYLIATRDHFGAALVDIILANLWGATNTAKVITQVNQI